MTALPNARPASAVEADRGPLLPPIPSGMPRTLAPLIPQEGPT